jgi:hypothetical protein
MVKRSKKTTWLIAVVLMAVLLQLAVIAFIATNVFSQSAKPRRSPQDLPREVERGVPQRYEPPPARRVQRQPARKLVAKPKPKPEGPRAEPPQFSQRGGIYTNALAITLRAKSTNAVIRYTLDGTEPEEKSALYSDPIPIRDTVVLSSLL